MVKVWFVRAGPEPTRGGLSRELPLETGIKTLGLSADDFLSGPERTPRFGDQSSRLSGIADYRHVVCEIEDAEARAAGRLSAPLSGWAVPGPANLNRTRP